MGGNGTMVESCSAAPESRQWAAGRKIYVDDDPGCEGHSPCFASLDGALGTAQNGDTISFLPGRYRGARIAQNKSLQRLRLTSERGRESTVITGACLIINGEVPPAGEIWIDHLAFRDCGPSTSLVDEGWGIYVETWAGVAVRVQDNVFGGNNGRGGLGLGSSTVGVRFAASVARNSFLGQEGEEGALTIDLPADSGEDYCIRVENNVLARNRLAVKLDYHPFSTNSKARFEFINNTFAANRGALGLPGPAAPSKWFNNVFFSNDLDFGEGTEVERVYDFRNNMIASGQFTGLAGNFSADPIFRGAEDFHLEAGSPAAANGTEVSAPLEDIEGVSRKAPPDIGAFALAGNGSSPRMPPCGDGIVQRGPVMSTAGPIIGYEACDDGNTQNGDGCSSRCRFEAAPPRHEISEESGGLCAVRSDHSLNCWGNASANKPDGNFLGVALSAYHACALTTDGTVRCWQQVGASYVLAGMYRQIASDYDRTCGLRSDGSIDCWKDASSVTNYPGNFVDVSVAGRVCGLTGTPGTPTCFGPSPDKVPSTPFIQFIPSPSSGWCGLEASGKLTCSGSSALSQTPEPFYGGLVRVGASRDFACGIRPDGRGICWSSFGIFSPPQDQVFIEITAGFNRGCGLTPDHRVHCWGDNLGYPRE